MEKVTEAPPADDWSRRAASFRKRAIAYIEAARGVDDRSDWRTPAEYIKLMPSELLEIPLWDAEGVLATDPDYLMTFLDLTYDIIVDLIEWGLAYEAKPVLIPWDLYVARGNQLALRLAAENKTSLPVLVGPFA